MNKKKMQHSATKKIGWTAGFFLLFLLTFCVQAREAKAADISGKVSLTPSTTAMTNKNVTVTVRTGKLKVRSVLWKQGKTTKKSLKKWQSAKDITQKKYFKAKMDGTYSVRVQDKKKNVTCKTIKISNIDKEGPVMAYKRTVKNKVATISLVTTDLRSGVAFVGYSKGYLNSKKKSDYKKAGAPASPVKITVSEDKLDATHQFKADTQGYYTIIVKDSLGNATIDHVRIKLWQDLTGLAMFDYNYAAHLESTFYDRWDNSFTAPWGIRPDTKGNFYAEYFLNGKYKKFSGTIRRGRGLHDDEIIWIQILVDNNVVYTSEQMDYKSQAVKFDVALNNCKYMKIKCFTDWNPGYPYHDYRNGYSSGGVYITDGQLYN